MDIRVDVEAISMSNALYVQVRSGAEMIDKRESTNPTPTPRFTKLQIGKLKFLCRLVEAR